MKSIVLTKQGGPEVFSLEDSSKPTPLAEEVVVKVYGTSATITELQWWPTWNTMEGSPRNNPIPAHEFSGVIESIGSNIKGYKVGDHVYGLNDWFKNGALAEFVSVQESQIYFKPDKLSHIEAGITPLSALTAYQGIISKGKVKSGETVLILGASGAVGGFAVQFAHHFGAKIIAVASKTNEDYLKSLGADIIVDYHMEKFENYSDGVDLILDLVGGEYLERSIKILGEKGRLFSLATSSKESDYFFFVESNSEDLKTIATLINESKITVKVDSVFPIERAQAAYNVKPINGKVAIQVHSID